MSSGPIAVSLPYLRGRRRCIRVDCPSRVVVPPKTECPFSIRLEATSSDDGVLCSLEMIFSRGSGVSGT